MDLLSLPSSVLVLLAHSHLGEIELRNILADALAANASRDEAKTRVQQVAIALIECSNGNPAASAKLTAALSIPTKLDEQLVGELTHELAQALAVGNHDRADCLRDALKEAREGRLFWQTMATGLLSERPPPAAIALPTQPAPR